MATKQAEVLTLQKDLMKAQKDAGLKAKPGPGGDLARALQEAEASNSVLQLRLTDMERELSDNRRSYNDDVRALQGGCLEWVQAWGAEPGRGAWMSVGGAGGAWDGVGAAG